MAARPAWLCLCVAVLAPCLLTRPAPAQEPTPARQLWIQGQEAMRQGRSMPLPELERRVLPSMGGADYLGPELNGDTYRLKFMQNGRVIWVDVDGQGRIIRRSRPQ